MSPRRPDYEQFLTQLHLDENASPWEQLARSEGRSSGDPVQVFPTPVVHADGASTCRFLVHGIRHVRGDGLPLLGVGDELALRAEPSNADNRSAVLVCAGSVGLGYVPDLLLEHLDALRSTGKPMSVIVEHVNGPEAPPHLRLLVRLDGFVPPGYRPIAGPGWETFVE